MARVSLERDRELAKQNLLRISVVADLLGVAPKTINAWLGEYHTKVRGVKYLNWTVVRAQRANDFAILKVPMDCTIAHALWELDKAGAYIEDPKPAVKLHAPTGMIEAASHAIDKAKAILHKASAPVTSQPLIIKEQDHTSIENLSTAENFESQIPLAVPVKEEEYVLTVPEEFKKKNASIANKKTSGDTCNECLHSFVFHTVMGFCDFAKGTAAACKCKIGA